MLLEHTNLFIQITKLAQLSQLLSFYWDPKSTRLKPLHNKKKIKANTKFRSRTSLFLRGAKLAQFFQLFSSDWSWNLSRFKFPIFQITPNVNLRCRVYTGLTLFVALQTTFYMQNPDDHSTVSRTIVAICVPILFQINYMVRFCNEHESELVLCINGFFKFHRVYGSGKILFKSYLKETR